MRQLALLLGLLVFTVGCGGNGNVAVKGKVTLKGAAAPKGTKITFWPVGAGETASGVCDESGAYELFSGVKGDVGAKPGKYKVVLAEGAPSGNAAYENMKTPKKGEAPGVGTGVFPKEYGAAETTPLEKEVASGSPTIDIDIQ